MFFLAGGRALVIVEGKGGKIISIASMLSYQVASSRHMQPVAGVAE
jgi:hypothetical protein